MVRTLTALGFALTLVGTAHAQDAQITVNLLGKSHSAIRSELYRAAEKVCASSPTAVGNDEATCVEATYDEALRQVRAAPRLERTAYAQTPSLGAR